MINTTMVRSNVDDDTAGSPASSAGRPLNKVPRAGYQTMHVAGASDASLNNLSTKDTNSDGGSSDGLLARPPNHWRSKSMGQASGPA
jgi:hypothetical protein